MAARTPKILCDRPVLIRFRGLKWTGSVFAYEVWICSGKQQNHHRLLPAKCCGRVKRRCAGSAFKGVRS